MQKKRKENAPETGVSLGTKRKRGGGEAFEEDPNQAGRGSLFKGPSLRRKEEGGCGVEEAVPPFRPLSPQTRCCVYFSSSSFLLKVCEIGPFPLLLSPSPFSPLPEEEEKHPPPVVVGLGERGE